MIFYSLIKIFNSLEDCLEEKNIFNSDTIFIIQFTQQKSHFHKNIQNNIIYLIDHNFSIANIKSDNNFYVKKPVSLSKVEEIIDEINFKRQRGLVGESRTTGERRGTAT